MIGEIKKYMTSSFLGGRRAALTVLWTAPSSLRAPCPNSPETNPETEHVRYTDLQHLTPARAASHSGPRSLLQKLSHGKVQAELREAHWAPHPSRQTGNTPLQC